MKEGDLILTPVPQSDGKMKDRPAVFLKRNVTLLRYARVWYQHPVTSVCQRLGRDYFSYQRGLRIKWFAIQVFDSA